MAINLTVPLFNQPTLASLLKDTHGHFTAAVANNNQTKVHDDLQDLADAVETGRYLIACGDSGVGKTHTVMTTLYRTLGKANVMHVSGTLSAIAMIEYLKSHKDVDQAVVIDDADALLSDAKALDILRQATDVGDVGVSNKVSHKTNTTSEKFTFKGRLYIITNMDVKAKAARHNNTATKLDAVIGRMDAMNFHFTPVESYVYFYQELPNILQAQIPNDLTAQHKVGQWLIDSYFDLRQKSYRTIQSACRTYVSFNAQVKSNWQRQAYRKLT